MSRKHKRIGWLVFLPVVLAITVVALVQARTRAFSIRMAAPPLESGVVISPQIADTQANAAKTQGSGARNLSLQPEAFNMGRRLGKRFSPGKREKSVLIGTLTIGSERQTVQTTRTQTDDGEQVEIMIAGSPVTLNWDAGQGPLSASSRATGNDRELLERLVFDSPDQFVLAQLRGASYYTIAHNVRPDGATDNSSGRLWNIVRVDDPERDPGKRPLSPWRLYYLNTSSGLIDRIVSDIQGQQIVAELTWTETNGEKVPAQITWTRQGQRIMQYNLTNFSHAQQQGAR